MSLSARWRDYKISKTLKQNFPSEIKSERFFPRETPLRVYRVRVLFDRFRERRDSRVRPADSFARNNCATRGRRPLPFVESRHRNGH